MRKGVRFDLKFNQEIYEAVRLYNRKIKRYRIRLKPVRVEEIKVLGNRREIRRKIKEMSLLTKKTAKKVNISKTQNKVYITQYEYLIQKRRKSRRLRQLTLEERKLKDLPKALREFRQKSIERERKFLKKELKTRRDYQVQESKLKGALGLDKRAIAFKRNVATIINRMANYYQLSKPEIKKLTEKLGGLKVDELSRLLDISQSFRDLIYRYASIEQDSYGAFARSETDLAVDTEVLNTIEDLDIILEKMF